MRDAYCVTVSSALMGNESPTLSASRSAGLILALLLTFSACHSFAAILLDRVVAVINRDVITWSELYRAVRFEYEAQTRGMSEEQKKEFIEARQAAFLDRLIVMRLILAKAKESGISVSDAEINSAIGDIRSQYNLSPEEFKEALSREGFVYEDYVERIKEQILMSKVVNLDVKSKVVVTDEELDEYMNEHPEFATPDMLVQLIEIHFRNPQNDEERKQLEEFLDLIDSGGKGHQGDLLQVSHAFEGSPLLVYAGQTDIMRSVDLREDFVHAIWKTEVGKISAPVRADDGIFVFQVLKKELLVSREAMMDNLRKKLTDTKTEKRYEEWIKKLKQGAFIEVKI